MPSHMNLFLNCEKILLFRTECVFNLFVYLRPIRWVPCEAFPSFEIGLYYSQEGVASLPAGVSITL